MYGFLTTVIQAADGTQHFWIVTVYLFLVISYLWISFLCHDVQSHCASDEKTDSFPLNSKIHSSVQVTVIFGWLNQKFAYPEDKPCLPCPGVVSGLQQRSNIWSSADCWVNKSFSYWKKRPWSWDCQRDFSTFTIAPRNSLPSLYFTGTILNLWVFLFWFTFPSKDLSWVLLCSEIWLLNACFDLGWPISLGTS